MKIAVVRFVIAAGLPDKVAETTFYVRDHLRFLSFQQPTYLFSVFHHIISILIIYFILNMFYKVNII